MLSPYKKDEIDYTNQVTAAVALAVRSSLWRTNSFCGCITLVFVCLLCCPQATNLQIMISLLMAMALKTDTPQEGTFESLAFGVCLTPATPRRRALVSAPPRATRPQQCERACLVQRVQGSETWCGARPMLVWPWVRRVLVDHLQWRHHCRRLVPAREVHPQESQDGGEDEQEGWGASQVEEAGAGAPALNDELQALVARQNRQDWNPSGPGLHLNRSQSCSEQTSRHSARHRARGKLLHRVEVAVQCHFEHSWRRTSLRQHLAFWGSTGRFC